MNAALGATPVAMLRSILVSAVVEASTAGLQPALSAQLPRLQYASRIAEFHRHRSFESCGFSLRRRRFFCGVPAASIAELSAQLFACHSRMSPARVRQLPQKSTRQFGDEH